MSYGTFSCTLEGFDDSFDTMKAIAEYFRDLAADDRYFGAEPPTPDAEMLARIAEREVARRVEARTESSGIVLRAGQALPPMAPTASPAPQPSAQPAPQAQPAPAPEAQEQDEPQAEPVPQPAAEAPREAEPQPTQQPAQAERPAAPQGAPRPETAEQAPAPAQPRPAPQRPAMDGDSVAAKLQRIRAVVGRQPSFASDEEEEDIAPASRQRPAAGLFDTAPVRTPRPAAPQPAATEPAAEKEQKQEPAEAESSSAQSSEPAAEQTDAARPARARVVRMRKADFERAVARGEAHRAVSEATEAAPSQAEASDAVSDDADADADIMEALARQGAEEAARETDETAAAAETSQEDMTPSTSEDADLSAEAERALLEELAALEREMGVGQDGPASQEIAADESSVPESEAESAEIETRDADADLEAAVAALSDEDEDQDDAAAPTETSAEAKPDEDEAVEAEVKVEAPQDDVAGAARSAAHHALATDEADLSRIMSATDARMADPETGRRRESISQLKAAVAATEAARRLGDVERPAKVEEAFRDDLRQAVRPRRPALPPRGHDEAAEARPERPRPAPLKLVAAQRVDLSDAPSQERAAPVRPRRVSVADASEPAPQPARPAASAEPISAPTPSESFSAFAARMGAQELGELLEAAAAYAAFIEGAEDVSRPQLMERVREASPEPVSREDGLRSFGTLLRQGALTRVRSGRFAVAPSSRFNPQRRAG
ncbi:hypothetical protein O4G76_16405 [Limimaricola sp. G21655-S1]|uniref:hypothetical protein n=1 Tax=Limimaricola sp. G21655-S1 TaxID=3014768 RepID=UPI0022AE952B|nr:hypothetical protein [Limimaricola sp. G21655-S1]MCZ4262423.1 hypothetical protein [Limimaricola sp. G21655-S1]